MKQDNDILDALADDVISNLETIPDLDEKMTWQKYLDVNNIQHMLILHIYTKRDMWYNVSGIMKRYMMVIMASLCSRYAVCVEDDNITIKNEYGTSVNFVEERNNYYVMVPMRYSSTPYDFFIVLEKLMKILKSLRFDYVFEIYRRDFGSQFEDLTKYTAEHTGNRLDLCPTTINSDGLENKEDFVYSSTIAKNSRLYRTLKTWGIFGSKFSEDKIETDYLRVLLRE